MWISRHHNDSQNSVESFHSEVRHGAGIEVVLCAGGGGFAVRAWDFIPTVGDVDAGLEVAGAHRLDRLMER